MKYIFILTILLSISCKQKKSIVVEEQSDLIKHKVYELIDDSLINNYRLENNIDTLVLHFEINKLISRLNLQIIGNKLLLQLYNQYKQKDKFSVYKIEIINNRIDYTYIYDDFVLAAVNQKIKYMNNALYNLKTENYKTLYNTINIPSRLADSTKESYSKFCRMNDSLNQNCGKISSYFFKSFKISALHCEGVNYTQYIELLGMIRRGNSKYVHTIFVYNTNKNDSTIYNMYY